MPFVSSFLSVHLSERTELSRPLTCSPSPYHLKEQSYVSAGYVVSVLPTTFTSPPLFFDAVFEEKERREKEEPRDIEGEERPGNANFTGIEWEQKNWHVQICKKEEKKNALYARVVFDCLYRYFLISTKRCLLDENSMKILYIKRIQRFWL